MAERIIVVDSFSKRRSLPGLRIGYAACTDAQFSRWIGNRLYGGTQVGLGLTGLLEDLADSCAVLSGNQSTPNNSTFSCMSANHLTIRRNLDLALDALGPWIARSSPLESGQNVLIQLESTSAESDVELVGLMLDQGVAVLPLTCFSARQDLPKEAHLCLRVTLSTPADEFTQAVERVRVGLSS